MAFIDYGPRTSKPTPPPFGPSALCEGERQRVSEALTALARELGGASISRMRQGPLERIIAIAAQVCGVPVRAVRSGRRSADVVRPRWLACLAMSRHTGATSTEMGQALGGKDHTSVLHALAAVEKRIAEDHGWAEAWAEIERRLSE